MKSRAQSFHRVARGYFLRDEVAMNCDNPYMRYWLLKCEPAVYSIDDLVADQITSWEGVRNYQARNFMKSMTIGDIGFFYHSNANPSGIAGIVSIRRSAYDDPFQFDPAHTYFEPRATPSRPVWVSVDIQFEYKFAELITLGTLRLIPELEKMEVLRQGSRLSIQPVTSAEFEAIVSRFKR